MLSGRSGGSGAAHDVFHCMSANSGIETAAVAAASVKVSVATFVPSGVVAPWAHIDVPTTENMAKRRVRKGLIIRRDLSEKVFL